MDRETVERAARIAHINLSEDELQRYGKDLSDILDYFQMLDEAPGEEGQGFNPVEVADALREDVPRSEIESDVLLRHMRTYDGYIRGPKLS